MATSKLSINDQEELARLREENAALKSKQDRAISFKVSTKGACSVYGLGRFPVTLYKEQWRKLLDKRGDLEAFLKANDKQLKEKE